MKPILNLQAGVLSFKAGNTCQFEKYGWSEFVRTYIVKAFPKGLYGCKTAEKQRSRPPTLSGKTNSCERGRVPFIHEQNLRPATKKNFKKKILQTNYKTDKKTLLYISNGLRQFVQGLLP